MHTITQSVQAELAAKRLASVRQSASLMAEVLFCMFSCLEPSVPECCGHLRLVEFPAGQMVGGRTSPAVMKEISEPRGCVCGVLPEHGPASTRHTDHIITDHMGSRQYGICPWHSCR